MESTQIQALYEPPLAAMPQLSEKPRQGFETKKTAWNPGPSVYNSTAAIGLRAGLALECVRETRQTGLYYMPARSYSPALGRFLQADPSGFGGGFNLYAYAGNDPVNLTDSTGQSPDCGGYTVTLSESVAGFFGPSLIVAATAKVNTYSIYASNGNLQLINPSGYTIGNYRYSTGLNGDTNPADRNKGPLPPGTYTLDPSEISAAGFARKYLDYRDWGDYRVPLHPVDGTNTYGRSGFFLHGGWKRLGSEGCLKVIDLNQDELFQTLMQVPGPVIVTDR